MTRAFLRHSIVTQDTGKCSSLRKIAIRLRLRRTSERSDTHGCPSVYVMRPRHSSVLDIILSGVRRQSSLIYLDGVIVFSRGTDEHLRHVDEILTLLRRAGITLKLTKCSFFQPKVDYLGHLITPGKLSVATENTKSFAHAQFPRNSTQLRSFLGAANVYRRFVTGYSGIARPLNAMLRKDAETDWDSPTNDELEAFETLKRNSLRPDTPTPESESPVHGRHGCVCVSTRSDVITEAERNGTERMDTDWILVENVNGLRTELLDDGT